MSQNALPFSLGGVEVYFDGIRAGLFSVSSNGDPCGVPVPGDGCQQRHRRGCESCMPTASVSVTTFKASPGTGAGSWNICRRNAGGAGAAHGHRDACFELRHGENDFGGGLVQAGDIGTITMATLDLITTRCWPPIPRPALKTGSVPVDQRGPQHAGARERGSVGLQHPSAVSGAWTGRQWDCDQRYRESTASTNTGGECCR